MQVAEVPGMLKGKDASGAVFFPSVGAGYPGEKNHKLSASVCFANDIVMRSDTHMTFYGLEEDI